jgi:hypothetical protein
MRVGVGLFLAWGTTGVAPAQTPTVAVGLVAAPRDLGDFIRAYQADRSSISESANIPWSESWFDRQASLYDEWWGKLHALNFDQLDPQGKIDWVLFRNFIEVSRARLALDRRRLAEMDPLLPFRKTVQGLERDRRAMRSLESASAAALVSTIDDEIKKCREGWDEYRKAKDALAGRAGDTAAATTTIAVTPASYSPVVAQRAAEAVSSIRRTLDHWYRSNDGYLPEFSWWVREPYGKATRALDDYAKFLRETVAGIKGEPDDPLIGDPIGPEALAADLANEMIPYTPEQLMKIGEREFAWCEEEAKKAATEMGLNGDWKAALASVKTKHAKPGEQDALAVQIAREAIQFLKDRDLITIPALCEETWRVERIHTEQQKIWPFMVYFGPAMGVSYPSEWMRHEEKLMSMRGNNEHFTRIVVPHELIPGHHLQGFMADRVRPYRQMFATPFLIEGWALYWEMRLWDLNYARNAEDRVGMLFWRMHRCARIIVSLKFHLGQMDTKQMIDFLVDRVGHERFTATSEVRRYVGGDYSPLYQCAYMIGGLQIRALWRDMVERGGMPDRVFNDLLLQYNSIPVELIQADLRGPRLTKESRASWMFAGEIEP